MTQADAQAAATFLRRAHAMDLPLLCCVISASLNLLVRRMREVDPVEFGREIDAIAAECKETGAT